MSAWETLARLQVVFAPFVVGLIYGALRGDRTRSEAISATKKLLSYYLIVHVVAALLWAGGYWVRAFALVAGIFGVHELLGVLARGTEPLGRLLRLSAFLFVAWVTTFAPSLPELPAGLLAFVAAALAMPVLCRTPRAVNTLAPGALYAALVVGLPLYSLLRLDALPGRCALFVYFAVVLTDGYSEICGKLFGRRHWIPELSPAKTLAGTAGGFVFGALVTALVFGPLVPGSFGLRLAIASATAVSAIMGDLAFSAIKRSVGVKDFSAALPGHGGFLDRFDSLLLAAPVLWVGLELLGR